MVDILIDYRQRQKIRADFKNFLYIAFKYINLPPPTQIQYDIADALQYGWEDTIIEGFRGVAKSTITGCYADWKFDNDPENYQLLELSANQTEACKFLKFSRDLLTIIPFLNYLIPDKANGQRDSALQFDVRPAIPRIQPSCKALGIFGQITGNRAVEIIADDIETSQNCDTMVKREAIRKAVTEFSPVLRPLKGRVLYLGTPHTETSIYNEEEARGCRVQIFPIKYPNAIEIEKYKGNLSTAIATRLENNPELVGKPTDPALKYACYWDIIEIPQQIDRNNFDCDEVLNTLYSDLKYSADTNLALKRNREEFNYNYETLQSLKNVEGFKVDSKILRKYKSTYERINNPEELAKLKAKQRAAEKKKHEQLKIKLNRLIKNNNMSELAKLAYSYESFEEKADLKKYLNPNNNLSFIWFDGDFVKTSQGVRVERQEVETLIKLWQLGKVKHGMMVGQYTILEITTEFVKIGCHKIPMQNIQELAEIINKQQPKAA